MNNLPPPILQTEIRLKWLTSLLYPFFLIKEKYEQYIFEKKYEARVTGQLMVLENYLNRIYDTEMRRIRIITKQQYEYYVPLAQEHYINENKFLGLLSEKIEDNYLPLAGETNIDISNDFVIITPIDTTEEIKKNIFGFAKKYTPLGIILQVK
ncbi:MAG: hypothetical protein ACRC0A_05160 [Chitinophagaceae bacterium]